MKEVQFGEKDQCSGLMVKTYKFAQLMKNMLWPMIRNMCFNVCNTHTSSISCAIYTHSITPTRMDHFPSLTSPWYGLGPSVHYHIALCFCQCKTLLGMYVIRHTTNLGNDYMVCTDANKRELNCLNVHV